MNTPASWTADLDRLLRSTPKPLWLVSSRDGERLGGMLATQVWLTSIDPAAPIFLIGIASTHFTAELVRATGRLLAQPLRKSQAGAALPFGLSSGRRTEKWKGAAEPEWSPGGFPLLSPAAEWVELNVARTFDGGPRTFFLADATGGKADADARDPRQEDPLLTDHGLIQAAAPAERAELKRLLLEDAQAQTAAWMHWKDRR